LGDDHFGHPVLLHSPQVKTYHTVLFHYFPCFCSPVWAMASCGSVAQYGLWPPVVL
jgi:hypothetical protein